MLNAFQDCIQLWIVSPASRRTLDAVAPGSLRLYDGHLDLHLLGDTRILIELDGPAVNLAVKCFIHDLTLFLNPTSILAERDSHPWQLPYELGRHCVEASHLGRYDRRMSSLWSIDDESNNPPAVMGKTMTGIRERRALAGRTIGLSLAACLVSTFAVSTSAYGKEYESGIKWVEPKVIEPGAKCGDAPSDATILFDGKDLSKWEAADKWEIRDGYAIPHGHDIKTKDAFGDCQLHIEWATPSVVSGSGQGRGNSGVYLMEKYEVQILDSYENRNLFRRAGRRNLQTEAADGELLSQAGRMADVRHRV